MIARIVSSAYEPIARSRRWRRPARSPRIVHPLLEHAHLDRGESEGDEEQRDREDGGAAGVGGAFGRVERAEDRVGQHVRVPERATLGEDVDLTEALERV